jgi:hypothetical protein
MKLYSAIFFIILVLVSCEYEPSGENAPDIKPPNSLAPLEVDLNVEGDTIYVIVEGNVDFKFQTSERTFHWVKFCIGINCEIYNSLTGSFEIRVDKNVWPGTHNLTIEVYTGSGSGSIADVLGVEGFLYSRSWTVIVENFIAFDDGNLKLTWNKYSDPDFKEYVIVKTPEGASGYTMAVIDDPDSTVVYDDSYFGGRAEYRVEVNTNSKKVQWISDSFEDDLPGIYNEMNNHLMTLTWDKSKYINNITGYEIYEFDSMFKIYKLIVKITDNNITSYVPDSLRFLKGYSFAFLPISKMMPVYPWGLDDKIRYLGSSTANYIGDKFDGDKIVTPMGDFMYYQITDYTNNCNYIYKYDYTKEEITDKIKLSLNYLEYAVSPNGKFIMINEGFEKVLIYNTDIRELKTYSLELFSDQAVSVSSPSISNNGIGVFQLYEARNNEGVVPFSTFVYDFNNDMKIFQRSLSDYNSSYLISADGKYLCESWHTIYQLLTDTVLMVPEISNELINISYFEFHMDDPELFVIGKNDYLYVKRLSDLSTISEHYLPDERVLNIDYNVNKFLTHSYGKMHLYDLNTSEQLWNYPSDFLYSLYSQVRFCYNSIYDSRSGRKLKVNQN